METRRGGAKHQLWHVSRGIVFTGDTRVIYPRLPMARFHSAPAQVTDDGSVSELPTARTLRESTSETELASSGAGNDNDSGQVPAINTQVEPAILVVEEPAQPPKETAPCKPPVSDLAYQIPENIFQKAREAREGQPESFWSYSLYRGPNEDGILDQKVKVHYCTSSHTTERVLKQYFMQEKVLGFDLEWAENSTKAQGARRNVSLVQLASPSRIALFHLALYPKGDTLVAPLLKQIMEDPNITKCGVWIKGDCTRLRTFLGINSRGSFELSHLYKLVKYSPTGQHELVDKKLVSLASQVQDCLKLPLFKGQVRTSDWSQPLNMSQLIYSASDAYAAVQLFAVLDYERRRLDPTPPLPHHAELNIPIQLADYTLPTSGEEPGQEPVEIDASTTDGETAAFTQYLNSIDGINLEEEDATSQAIVAVSTGTLSVTTTTAAATPVATKTTTATATKRPSIPTKTPSKPRDSLRNKDPRIAEAQRWTEEQFSKTPGPKARTYQLRAYYLWHKYDELHPGELAALLRDPPLSLGTVCNYIMEGIELDGLPFDQQRLKEEVMPGVRQFGRYRKYRALSVPDSQGAETEGKL